MRAVILIALFAFAGLPANSQRPHLVQAKEYHMASFSFTLGGSMFIMAGWNGYLKAMPENLPIRHANKTLMVFGAACVVTGLVLEWGSHSHTRKALQLEGTGLKLTIPISN